jgi:hypothetical protein
VYDSITHGSWERFRDSASRAVGESATAFERVWIAEYIRQRDRWLASVPRLATTRYRTRFFLNQIKAGNWQLTPPFSAQGVRITNKTISQIETLLRGPLARVDGPAAESEPANDPTSRASHPISPAQDPHEPLLETQPPVSEAETGTLTSVSEINNETCLDEVENEVNSLAAKYDQIERIATTITTRNDAAKSLWTTVVGSVTQTFWALFGLMAGIPREVWLVVAIVAAALMLMYLYRQITLGKIRERKQADSTV